MGVGIGYGDSAGWCRAVGRRARSDLAPLALRRSAGGVVCSRETVLIPFAMPAPIAH
jgi:hypothetical protein